ncbi:hypothetical protein N7501_006461 [Penicillium viridicatum]|nr:hypothetical protein N7501_006461 [Penicillium viridicatum]
MGSFLSTWDAGAGLSKNLLSADTLPLPFLIHLQQLNQFNQWQQPMKSFDNGWRSTEDRRWS